MASAAADHDTGAASVPIDEALALARAGKIFLKKVESKGPPAPAVPGKPAKPPVRYFWNRVGRGGSVRITVGNAFNPKDQQPFLLVKPSKFDPTSPVDQMGAFTRISDVNEARCWAQFNEWMANEIAKVGLLNPKGRVLTEEQLKAVIPTKIEPVAKVPNECSHEDSSPSGYSGFWNGKDINEVTSVTLSQKLNEGVKNPGLGTACRFLLPITDAEGNPDYDIGDNFPMADLNASRNIFTVVELGDVIEKAGKLRTMLYVRELYAFPVAKEESTTFRMGSRTFDTASKRPRTHASGGDAAGADTTFSAPGTADPYSTYDAYVKDFMGPGAGGNGDADADATPGAGTGTGPVPDTKTTPEVIAAVPATPVPATPVPAAAAVTAPGAKGGAGAKGARKGGAASARAEIAVAALEETA